jgi:hypothetical protein
MVSSFPLVLVLLLLVVVVGVVPTMLLVLAPVALLARGAPAAVAAAVSGVDCSCQVRPAATNSTGIVLLLPLLLPA